MEFALVPVLSQMEALYQLPRNRRRFDTYLSMLQGEDGSDMVLPIAAYNPMAKEAALAKLRELMELDAEGIAEEVIAAVNQDLPKTPARKLSVVLNMADDVGGSWSSRYTTDYTSRFDFESLLKRDFCTPYFWTSEAYTAEIVRQRIFASLHRTHYWLMHGKPITLEDHVRQETFVYGKVHGEVADPVEDSALRTFYERHRESEDYGLIFNFFYGDRASGELSYVTYGMPEMGGFRFAASHEPES